MMMAPTSRTASTGIRQRTFFSKIVMAVHQFVKSRSRTNRLSRIFSVCSSTRLKAGFQLFCFAYFIFALTYLLRNKNSYNRTQRINIKDFDFSILRKDDGDPYSMQIPFDSDNTDTNIESIDGNTHHDFENLPSHSQSRTEDDNVNVNSDSNGIDNDNNNNISNGIENDNDNNNRNNDSNGTDNDNGNNNTSISEHQGTSSPPQSNTANMVTSKGNISSSRGTAPRNSPPEASVRTPTNVAAALPPNSTAKKSLPHVQVASTVPKVSKVSKVAKPPEPSLVLGFSVHGGLGNQIYDMLEALYLVRHTRSTMLLPELLPRADVDGTVSYRAGTRVWDLGRLFEGTKGQPIFPFIPSRCKNRIHVLYIFIRRNGIPPPVDTIPGEVRNAACSLAKASPSWNPQVSTCDTLFENTDIRIRRQNLTLGGNDEFIKELKGLPRKEKCIWISGHTYDRAGSDGDEYLYSHMHYLKAHPRISNAARKWPLSALGVVHIRYDEEVCKTSTHNSSYICVRATKDGRLKTGQVYWAPIKEYVQKIAGVLHSEGVLTVYLAASPYVPMATIMELKMQLGKLIRVQRMASSTFDDEADVNFLERELAIESKVFIGDFASTWSGTVYFKRRTEGKTTLWANVILGKAQNLGYYRNDGPLELPD